MPTHDAVSYIGRFAPSPTGPLHFGSLVAAVASYLRAKSCGGQWQLRIEDIDPPRQIAGADRNILHTLETYGFRWDGPVIYQSASHEAHQQSVQALLASELAYPCSCSRRDLADAPQGAMGSIYPGNCRSGCTARDVAIRVRTDDEPIGFSDILQGYVSQRLESESGDFVIQRRDGLMAYHLACVVDDHLQGITEVVRGIDLLESTPRQIYLQRCLGFEEPAYLHIPVVLNSQGQKLSKLTGAEGIPDVGDARVLSAALAALRQPMMTNSERCPLDELWSWAEAHWQVQVLAGATSIATHN